MFNFIQFSCVFFFHSLARSFVLFHSLSIRSFVRQQILLFHVRICVAHILCLFSSLLAMFNFYFVSRLFVVFSERQHYIMAVNSNADKYIKNMRKTPKAKMQKHTKTLWDNFLCALFPLLIQLSLPISCSCTVEMAFFPFIYAFTFNLDGIQMLFPIQLWQAVIFVCWLKIFSL